MVMRQTTNKSGWTRDECDDLDGRLYIDKFENTENLDI